MSFVPTRGAYYQRAPPRGFREQGNMPNLNRETGTMTKYFGEQGNINIILLQANVFLLSFLGSECLKIISRRGCWKPPRRDQERYTCIDNYISLAHKRP